MKINISKEITAHPLTMLSHFILAINKEGIGHIDDKTAKSKGKGAVCEVKLIVDGHEIDIKKVLEGFESQIDDCIKEAAKELYKEKLEIVFTDKLYEIQEAADDLKDRLEEEIDKRLKDWERE